ncbi:nucleoside-diphosphate sugar epimerase [Paenibacillus albilobatus]|uniref:Nucleoside-diphosphate sugar epimerase n=1 Tax=Paenibacillus albilobatus TaxID=2716884 RepID=A0A920CFK4_9BACL|nr:NAD(P)-dependent oxidoreductase [Paenibacillus albilobatus]GIO35109.1 nucleoside-diphosphate sugar epimerase [Paenibacillus albilobatus]
MTKIRSVLVTGAGGYIGRHVVKALLDLGIEVSAIDNKTEDIDFRANKIEYNIFSNRENIYEDLGKPDVCLHLAWRDGFIHNSESHMQNLYSHYNFLRKMVDGGLKHVVVMGTMHEIGYFEGEIDENTPTNPHSLYGIAKNSLRQALQVFLKDKDVIFQWLRAFYIYGDDIKSNSIFSKIIRAEQDGMEWFPFTSGKNKYDFITVEDLAKQIALCSIQNEVTGIINCCSGKPVPLGDVVEKFIKKNGFRIKLKYGVYPDRTYDSPAIWGNNEKIEKVLNRVYEESFKY